MVLSTSFLVGACADDKTAAKAAKPAVTDSIVLGMGCFWGAEKRMAAIPGVLDVESGYANGEVAGTYEAVLAHEKALRAGKSSQRNHAEVVKVTFDPAKVDLEKVLIQFWESHNPTQGNRQGNDVGTNYRSAIYTHNDAQQALALKTKDAYQKALSAEKFGTITTEIAPLKKYYSAEEYHQNYLVKNPDGYCGLGGTGVKYPNANGASTPMPPAATKAPRLEAKALNFERQLIVFEADDCAYCRKFKADVLDHWKSPVAVVRTLHPEAPAGWSLEKALFATPTMVLFEKGKEVSRYTGYNGETARFWKWLGFHLLTPAQQKIAFEQGTERPGTGSNLDEKRPGTFVDPISGVPLFRSDTKFESGTGWPSFFNPLPGAISLHEDVSMGMKRVEVRSASSGIHLGHVFDDGPPPTGKRYCINGNVLKFVPDAAK
ncbi:peptide-methionine (S)-S-oxide reductase MsrA [Dechloromonas denitrificans]|uniref:peptide-methionine (S)-S-oxide reductase MsrA n=1 Tax=Dechloromonas denitrificans TaxID=281362 RepID=UPI001CFB93CF|nr:peptide-methionine (S)-S-oxide reductase MsrA [Dechloromonas denitrificans]UCV09897.1 peptide-methionine (S)-S-oxide reductase MsrA [Dechloromonas denitrificans]